ncbi:MAG: hypothetical protein ACRCZK_03250 [Oscillospiraceae bacterium]
MLNITKFKGEDKPDILVDNKAINYTKSMENILPFTQGQFYFDSKCDLYCDIITFEELPKVKKYAEQNDLLGICISFDKSNVLSVFVGANNEKHIYLNCECLTNIDIKTKVVRGDNQQGIYWGVKFSLDFLYIKNLFNIEDINENTDCKFNFINKYNFNNNVCYCSYYKLKNENIYSHENLDHIKINIK